MYFVIIAIIASIVFLIIKGGSGILQKTTNTFTSSLSDSMGKINIWMVIILIINLLLIVIILTYYFNGLKNKPIGRPGLRGFRGPKGDDAVQAEL